MEAGRAKVLEALEAYHAHIASQIRKNMELFPEDVLSRWDEIAQLTGLDGTINRNPANGAELLEAYAIRFPKELRIVAGEVHGLIGPGMPYHNLQQLTFWSLTMDTSRVKTSEELENETGLNDWDPQGWKMEGGWNSGDGQDASYCVVYCRKPGEEGWKWRYVVNLGERGMHVFESIPEFLGWYAHFREDHLDRLAAEDRTARLFD
ncbi:hypothetical protein CcaCcLH18_08840 [Colletotrichum camelliae]|nr:hypothetical protein CcaCcLH18_08840 [Colletotrichum camelliae]